MKKYFVVCKADEDDEEGMAAMCPKLTLAILESCYSTCM
jgi:hypothetical protein